MATAMIPILIIAAAALLAASDKDGTFMPRTLRTRSRKIYKTVRLRIEYVKLTGRWPHVGIRAAERILRRNRRDLFDRFDQGFGTDFQSRD
ncbi:hypothetical protein ACUQ99_16820 [Azospirillum sp. A39]